MFFDIIATSHLLALKASYLEFVKRRIRLSFTVQCQVASFWTVLDRVGT